MTTIVYVALGWLACGIAGHVVLKIADKYATKTANPALIYALGPVLVAILILVSIFQLGLIARLTFAIRWDLHRLRRRQKKFLHSVHVRTLVSCIGCNQPTEAIYALSDKPYPIVCSHSCVSVALGKLHEEEQKRRDTRMEVWWAKWSPAKKS